MPLGFATLGKAEMKIFCLMEKHSHLLKAAGSYNFPHLLPLSPLLLLISAPFLAPIKRAGRLSSLPVHARLHSDPVDAISRFSCALAAFVQASC